MYALISNNVMFSCFSNVLECCTCSRMNFTARMVWRYCAVAHLRENHDYLYLNYGCVHPFPCFFCFTWEFGNMSPKNNCPRNSSNCFRKKQITKFHCKIGNQLFNKFSIVPLVSFLLLFSSKNLTKAKDRLECHVGNFQHLLKSTKQIKISMV